MKNVKTKILSISVFLLSIYFLSIVSASQSYFYMPDGMSVEQFQQLVKDANGDKGNFLSVIFGSGFQLTSIACHDTFPYNCYWGSFTSTNPLGNGGCSSSDAPSNCIISPDSVSSTACNGKTSDQCCVIARTNYNSDLINLQCYCNPRQTGCSGGGTSGDRKCSGSSVFQCNSNGAWDYVTNCANGCSGAGSCNSQPQCTPHASSRCEGNTVYWYDSCGSQEEPKLQCGSNEQCSNGNCQQVCTEQPIGATFCVGNSVKQQYQKSDCSVENRDVITCTSTQTCSNGICREQSCPTCLADGQFSSCVNGKMSRT
ncbi:MAG: hypothetical protein NT076_02675, partial [Candidatus Pacearchaeota archaeon]|nr:hypothetical protein [Candidatus Pacearchaeota archaeon]